MLASTVCLALATFCLVGMSMSAEAGRRKKCPPSHDWDIMKLTQSWPPAVCVYLQNEKKECKISSSIKTWIIHGLWPTQTGTECPNYCEEIKFNISQVQGLRPRLDMNWPAIDLHDKPEYSWKHEWEKHGTCGMSLPAIKDELHYFNVTLGLHQRFNLSMILQQTGIAPSSSQTYKAEAIEAALTKSIGVAPSITCEKSKADGKYYMEQVEVCLDKTFKPVNCPAHHALSGQPLLFESELPSTDNRGGNSAVRGTINGCGSVSEDIYFKPFPSFEK